jgi:hypothetical protein
MIYLLKILMWHLKLKSHGFYIIWEKNGNSLYKILYKLLERILMLIFLILYVLILLIKQKEKQQIKYIVTGLSARLRPRAAARGR